MRRIVSLSLAVLLGVPALVLIVFVTFQPLKVLPRLAPAPGFALTDQDGQPVTSDSLRGAITLFSFTYAHCQAPCESPVPLLRELQSQLAQEDLGVPVHLVTISVDPARDTPAALRAFGQQAGADFTRWRFATESSPLAAARVLDSFDVFAKARADGTFDLDTRLWLTDGWGIRRVEYSTYLPSPARVLRDVRLVAAEARNSRGWAHYVYEAAHLLGCYSQ